MMEIIPEIEFAQDLVSSDIELCEKTLKNVGKYFATKSAHEDAFSEESMMKLWKGLYYYFWNADKPLFQEEKADIISGYIHVFQSTEFSFLYFDTFLQTMVREWEAIDRYRIEKFMMLIRKCLSETYRFLKHLKWKLKWVKRFRKVMKKTVINSSPDSAPLGLKIHVSDIYMEELAKVGSDDLTSEMVEWFLIPYCHLLVESDKEVFLDSISKDVFLYLINQDADEEEYHEFPVLKFDATSVQNLLMKYANLEGVRTQNRKLIYRIIKEFEDYKNGLSQMDRLFAKPPPGKRLRKKHIEKAALRLLRDEAEHSKKKVKRYEEKKSNVSDSSE